METLSLPDPFQFIILCLATYRLTRLVIEDTIFSNLRDKFWDKFPPESTKLGYFITCPWCVGLWLSLIVTICYTIVPIQTMWACLPFAISSLVGLLTALEHR
jgi:sterol desaturase/sphingolipid hydroxylase (fatty acid hydroxylase superfamily)